MFIQPRKPDAAAARSELKRNVRNFAITIICLRASTYVLDLLQQHA
jgi:hypothetical protein